MNDKFSFWHTQKPEAAKEVPASVTPQAANSYQDCKAYQHAHALAVAVERAVMVFSKVVRQGIGNKITHSTQKICGEILAGYEAKQGSELEWNRHLQRAIDACVESKNSVDFCRDLKHIPSDTAALWQHELDSIIDMLHTMKNN